MQCIKQFSHKIGPTYFHRFLLLRKGKSTISYALREEICRILKLVKASSAEFYCCMISWTIKSGPSSKKKINLKAKDIIKTSEVNRL